MAALTFERRPGRYSRAASPHRAPTGIAEFGKDSPA
jgi:hypothetical protein